MRALVQDRYGSPDVLRIDEVATPTPGPSQVLVHVHAASVNARDWHVMRGEPRMARAMDRSTFGRSGPKVRTLGTDFAGTIESVGEGVSQWRAGDLVFGESVAAFAEYVVAKADFVASVPSNLTPEEAAAIPLPANTALICLRKGSLEEGQRLLINGASGGVGTFAIQLAKSMGAHITAVCSARNAEQARSLGADVVVNYATEDFCATGEEYDVVFDLVGNRSLRDLRSAVKSTGVIVLSGGGVSGEGRIVGPLKLMIRAALVGRFSSVRVEIPQGNMTKENLQEIAKLAEAGSLRPVVERTYPFEEAADAVRHLEVEHARGKVVISMGQ